MIVFISSNFWFTYSILDEALSVIYAFDEKVRKEYDLNGWPTLQDTYESYLIQIEDQLKKYGVEEI